MGYFDKFKQKVTVNGKNYHTNQFGSTHVTSRNDAGMDVQLNERGTSQRRRFTNVCEIEVNQENNTVRIKKNDGSVVHLKGEYTTVHAVDIPSTDVTDNTADEIRNTMRSWKPGGSPFGDSTSGSY